MESSSGSDRLARFLELSRTLMERTNIDPYIGERLLQLAQVVDSNATEKRFQRPEGDYTNELIMLCRTGGAMARTRLKDEKLASDFEELAKDLGNHPIRFVPAEIVAVEISKDLGIAGDHTPLFKSFLE